MAASEPTYIYDAVLSFEGGVDSGKAPLLLAKNQLAWAINCTVRGDFVTNRSSYRKINLSGAPIPAGLFQEAAYYQPDTLPERMFAAIGGQFIQFVPDQFGNAVASNLTGTTGGQLASSPQEWMWQAENFLIWNDGANLPLFYDGAMIRRSLGNSYQTYAIIPNTAPIAAPAIGSSIVLPLSGPPSSVFGQTVLLNGAYYTVSAFNSGSSLANGNALLTPLFDTAGDVHTTGSQINSIPSQLAVGLGYGQLDPATISVTVDYINNITQGMLIYLPGQTQQYVVELITGANSFFIRAPNFGNITIVNAVPNGIITNGQPTRSTIVGTLSAPFTAPAVGSNVAATLVSNYTGTPGADVWIGGSHYIIFPANTPNAVTLTNVDDVTAGNVTTVTITGSGTITLPALKGELATTTNGSELIPVQSTANLIVGQQIRISDGTHVGTFSIAAIVDSATLQLTWQQAVGDSVTGTVIAAASPIVFTGLINGLTIQSLPELPAGRMGTYGLGRIWQSGTDGITYMGGDIVGYSSGSAAYNFRDAVLKMTANNTLLTGFFRVPGGAGQITGMIFPAQLDTSLGQGALQIFSQRDIFSCNAPIDATAWQTTTNPLVTESLKGEGAGSHWSIVLSNADIFFRSSDAQIRSLLLARLDFNKWGDTPISYEVSRTINNENLSLVNFMSGAVFDNRMLESATPTQGTLGVYHKEIIALNFDTISSIAQKSPAVYDGVWHGLNTLKLVTGFFSGVQRTFAFCLNTTSSQIELWEIMTTANSTGYDNGTTPITMQFETPIFFDSVKGKSPFDLCRLTDGEMYADSMQGIVNFKVEYRPDYDQNWHLWNSWSINAGATPTYRTRMGFGIPAVDGNTAMQRPSKDAYFFQLRVTISGPCVVRGIRLKASILPSPDIAPLIQVPASPVPVTP